MSAAGIDIGIAAVDEGTLGSLVKASQVGCDPLRQKPIVGIQKDHVASAGRPPAGVASGGQTLVGLPDELDLGISAHNRAWIICRAVVDHDHLTRTNSLSERALDCLGQKSRVIIGRNNDRYEPL